MKNRLEVERFSEVQQNLQNLLELRRGRGSKQRERVLTNYDNGIIRLAVFVFHAIFMSLFNSAEKSIMQ